MRVAGKCGWVVAALCLLAQTGAKATPVQWSGNNHWYDLTAWGSWSTVNAWAVASSNDGMPGYLVSITSEAELNFLLATFGSSQTRHWIGFTDEAQEGTWVWTSGEPVTYTNWWPGEPNNSGGENYAVMEFFQLSGKWNDLNGRTSYYGIVEYDSAIPEPSTWALIAAGLLGLAGLRRRRHN